MQKRWAVPLAVVLVVAASAVAAAAIPSSDGTIHACRNTKTGVLRVVDAEAGQTCGKDETVLTWKQAGFTGYEVVNRQVTLQINSYQEYTEAVFCPTGKRPLGGGFQTSYYGPIMTSRPATWGDINGAPNWVAWEVSFDTRQVENPGSTHTLNVWAICASVGW